MRIEKVEIENYKSIKKLEFTPNAGLNAFIGANSTGKSNVFDAINWLLGPTYPTFNATKKEDHFRADEDNKIRIKLEFDDGHSLELNENKEAFYNGKTEIKSGLFYDDNNWNCKGEIREQYSSAYLGVDRKILDYLPSNRWSLVGRILQEVNNQFLKEAYEHNKETRSKEEWLKKWLGVVRDKLLFSVKDNSGQNVMEKFTSILQEESAKQLGRDHGDLKIDLSLYDPWNFYKTLQLLVYEQDIDMEFQASSLGMGVQASISIAILKAYSELNLANKSPIFVDEPELFLHPQAQRNFYKILRELATDRVDESDSILREGTQIFYTTHSPDFLSAGAFDEVFIIRKTKNKGTHIRYAEVGKFIEDLRARKDVSSNYEDMLLHYRNAYENTGDTQKANEAFFAKKILLVEGQAEALILPYLFSLLNFDHVKAGLTIVRCGGKTEIDRFYRLYTEFGIPCYVLFDGDKQLIGTDNEVENVSRNKEILKLFDNNEDYPDGSICPSYLGFENNFEMNLGFETSKKGLELYKEVKTKIMAIENIPDWVNLIVEEIKKLEDSSIESVLEKEVPDSE
jgi:putative ATP-dependent endonuclease of OLD family